jgi:autotransporter-associated beta strand protein
MKKTSKLTFFGALLGVAGSLSAQVTGFNGTGAGPYDYNNVANWVDETINGIWDSTLTLTAGQTVTFDGDTILGTGLRFSYTGAPNVTLIGTGGNRELTLGGDILVNTVSGNRTITIGSTSANAGLAVNLGGTGRTFTVNGTAGSNNIRSLVFANNVYNGSLTLNGGGNINLNGTANSLASLQLQNANLRLNGVSSANSVTTIANALTIDGSSTNGGASIITITPNGSNNTTLTANSLVREDHGVAFFRGNNLGGTLGANGVSNITFTNAPTAQLVGGGGAAGTKNISILPWAVGATTASGSAESFVTYDANGIRALAASEFEVYADGYNGAVTGSDLNSRVASGGTVTFTGDNTVNSLFVGDGATNVSTTLNGDGGVLTVVSGAVFFQRATVSQNLNFGSREGVIGFTQGQASTFSGGIAGTGGVTFYQPVTNANSSSAGTGLTVNGAATYTGDTNVLGRVVVTNANFLPNGSRTGNVNVYGILELSTTMGINGLSGSGVLAKAFSNPASLTIGGNDANGNFTGVISNFGLLTIIKTGTGTQIFAGANTYGGGTTVNAGTLLINGRLSTQGNVNVTGGILGGAGDGTTTGIIGGNTTVAAGGKLAPGAAAGLAGNLTFSNGLNLSASSNDTGAYLFNLNAVSNSDSITLTSGTDFALNVGTLDAADFTFTIGAGFGAGTYVLFDANSAIAGTIGTAEVDFGGGFTGTLSIDTINNDVLLTVVPEPSVAMLAALGAAGLCWRRRSRK